MSWFTKSSILLTPFIFTASAMAARVQFHGTEIRASLSATPIRTNASVAPVAIRLQVPGIEVNRSEDGFDTIQVEGLEPLVRAGEPELFATGSLLAVPAGYEPEIIVENQEVRTVSGVLARPAQRKFRCAAPQNMGFAFNAALYESRGSFPREVASIEEVGYLQGMRLVRVALNPLQQDFNGRSLNVTTDIQVKVKFNLIGKAEPLTLPPSFYGIVRNVAANGRDLGEHLVMGRGPERMLIVVGDAFKDAIAPFVAWKRAKGLKVDVVTFTEAGGSKEKVKEYGQTYYDASADKPTYYMYIGNKTSMPAFAESTSSGQAPSDYRFALLSGTDAIPDVLYGRFLADNADDLARQINRAVAYEATPEKGAGWYSTGSTIASPDGSGPSDKEYADQVREAMKAGTYTEMDAFEASAQTAKPDQILEKINGGRTWISYFGHGSGTAWASTNGYFSNTHVAQTTNADRLPVIIDVACLNSSWVSLAKPFGKAWVTQTYNGKEAGAVAFYGGSVSISWHPPAVMSVGVSKYHFEKPVHSLGGSVAAGQLYLVEKMGTGSDVTDNLKWYNLFGDPAMLIRTNTPKAYQVKHALKGENGRVQLTVTAVDSTGSGVAGITAALGTKNGLLDVAQTNAQGEAVLSTGGVGQLEPGSLLTTTGYNAETQTVQLN